MNPFPARLVRIACFLILAALPSALSAATPDRMVVYKTTPQGELKLHIFNPPDHDPSRAAPAIVFFFGGGWISGTVTQFYPQCERLTALGMVAISAEYRTRNSHGTSPRECVEDAKSAVRWLRAHAAELGIDPARLAAGGGSAGGHIAAAAGTATAFDAEDDDMSVSARPNALVLFNPVIDNGPDGYGHKLVSDYWERFSPMHNLDADTPPTVVFLGTKDDLIPVAIVERFQQRMLALGLRSELYLYPDKAHGFFNYAKRENFESTMAQTEAFLTSCFGLERPAAQ